MLTGDLEVDAMVEDLLGRGEYSLMMALNLAAEKVLNQAELHAPKAEVHEPRPGDPSYPEKRLAESGGIARAAPGHLQAEVFFEGPYAAAQEVGEMVYTRGDKEIHWVAENYTAPDTGKHYLSNALKAVGGELEAEVAVQSKVAYGEIPGVKPPKSTVSILGRRLETDPPATGEISQIMAREESAIEHTPPESLIRPPMMQ